MKGVLVLFLLGFAIASAEAQYVNGSKLSQRSAGHQRAATSEASRQDFNDATYFMAYVVGVADALEDADIICVPTRTTVGQLTAITTKYLNANPEQWGLSGSQLIARALRPVFPCK